MLLIVQVSYPSEREIWLITCKENRRPNKTQKNIKLKEMKGTATTDNLSINTYREAKIKHELNAQKQNNIH